MARHLVIALSLLVLSACYPRAIGQYDLSCDAVDDTTALGLQPAWLASLDIDSLDDRPSHDIDFTPDASWPAELGVFAARDLGTSLSGAEVLTLYIPAFGRVNRKDLEVSGGGVSSECIDRACSDEIDAFQLDFAVLEEVLIAAEPTFSISSGLSTASYTCAGDRADPR